VEAPPEVRVLRGSVAKCAEEQAASREKHPPAALPPPPPPRPPPPPPPRPPPPPCPSSWARQPAEPGSVPAWAEYMHGRQAEIQSSEAESSVANFYDWHDEKMPCKQQESQKLMASCPPWRMMTEGASHSAASGAVPSAKAVRLIPVGSAALRSEGDSSFLAPKAQPRKKQKL
jgi:hypothetical protein